MQGQGTVIGLCAAKYHGRDPGGRRQHPDDHIDDLGLDGRAEIQGLDGVTHGHVAVHAHHGQCEDAGEHVVVIDGDEDFARHLAKRPGAEQVVRALEGHGGGDQGVGHGQVKDVDVGGCFHFGVSVAGWKEGHTKGLIRLAFVLPLLSFQRGARSMKSPLEIRIRYQGDQLLFPE